MARWWRRRPRRHRPRPLHRHPLRLRRRLRRRRPRPPRRRRPRRRLLATNTLPTVHRLTVMHKRRVKTCILASQEVLRTLRQLQ